MSVRNWKSLVKDENLDSLHAALAATERNILSHLDNATSDLDRAEPLEPPLASPAAFVPVDGGVGIAAGEEVCAENDPVHEDGVLVGPVHENLGTE